MDGVRERLGDARAGACIERLESDRDVAARVRHMDPKRVAILVDRLADAVPAADREYVVAIAVSTGPRRPGAPLRLARAGAHPDLRGRNVVGARRVASGASPD